MPRFSARLPVDVPALRASHVGAPLRVLTGGLLVWALFSVVFLSLSPLVPLVCFLLHALLLALGSFYPPAGVFARPLLRGPAHLPHIALTFDDGPDPAPEATSAVLRVLKAHGARATFFVIADRARRHPALVAEIVAAGHQVENHSLYHARTTPFFSVRRLIAELRQAQHVLTDLTGRPPRYFRSPIGIVSPPIAQAAQMLGLRLAGWTRKGRDGLASTTVEAALCALRPALFPGAILLLHDARERPGLPPIAPHVLARLLPELAAAGLRCVTLDQLMGDEPAAPFTAKTAAADTASLAQIPPCSAPAHTQPGP